jgi:hypothetical protein
MIDNGTSEVDLKQTLQRMIHWLFRHLKSLQVYFLFVLVLSISFFFLQKRKFNLTYTISSDYMSGQKIEIIYDDIKKMIQYRQYSQLASLLKLPQEKIKDIAGFSLTVEEPFQNLQLSNVKPDFHFNETNTSVKITLIDSGNAHELVDALNHFIASSNYFLKIKKNELISMQKINDNLEKEKKDLDSIHTINLQKFSKSNGNLILMNDLSQIKQNTYIIQERLINNRRGIERIEEPINLISHPIIQPQSTLMLMLIATAKGAAITTLGFLLLLIYKKTRNAYRSFKRHSMS